MRVCRCVCNTRSCAPFIVRGVVPSSPLIPVLFKVKDVKDWDGNSAAAEGMWPIINIARQHNWLSHHPWSDVQIITLKILNEIQELLMQSLRKLFTLKHKANS